MFYIIQTDQYYTHHNYTAEHINYYLIHPEQSRKGNHITETKRHYYKVSWKLNLLLYNC